MSHHTQPRTPDGRFAHSRGGVSLGSLDEAHAPVFATREDYTEHVRYLLAKADTSGTVYTDEQVERVVDLTLSQDGHSYHADPDADFWAAVADAVGDGGR